MPGKLAATIARRLQAEVGLLAKEHGGRLRVCLVYPNTYFVGMSSLGFQAIYHLFNAHPRVLCERAFLPDPDDLAELKRTGDPLVSHESLTPLDAFDVIAFSVAYELDYLHLARILRLARVPALRQERGPRHPLVMAGGAAVSLNPEPLADLVDLFVLGEAEPVATALLDALADPSLGRAERIEAAARLPGVYVPRSRGFSGPVVRQHLEDLDQAPTYSRLLTPETEFGDLFLVEVSRGCGRACRFCATPQCFWPPRWRRAERILEAARIGLAYRSAVGLVGAAVSDHPEVDAIAKGVVGLGARLSVSSLRADSVTPALVEALAAGGARSLTIAPETGTEALRETIGKPIGDDQVIASLRLAAAAGMREAKLYFMVGLPGEIESDVTAIPALVGRCLREAGLARVTVAAGGFVPKPLTPYERERMLPTAELARRLRQVREALRRERHVVLALESANWSHVEGVLSRGDRRLGPALVRAEQLGGNLAAWRRALAEAGLEAAEFIRGRAPDEPLPWDFIRGKRSRFEGAKR